MIDKLTSLITVLQENTYTQSEFNLAVGLGAGLGILFSLIVGFIIGWYVSMRMFKKQLKENPPISEDQIRELYAQVGRKPSEKQIKQIMNSFKRSAK